MTTHRIPGTVIDTLIARADIVEVIRKRIPSLRKSGRNHMACCPFHQEKTPSFSVNAQKQFYHCFGCGVGGNVITFLMQYDHLSFIEAVKLLAGELGFTLDTAFEKKEEKIFAFSTKSDYALLDRVATYYEKQWKQPFAKPAIDYLKSRGFEGAVCKHFRVGFAPKGWDLLLTAFGQNTIDSLVRTGMFIEKEDNKRPYERFRDRIMFPVRDTRGRVIAFGGRVVETGDPKYLNSPETPLFHKSEHLYGLYEALSKARTPISLVVVEGYLDVIALAQFGIHNAVATLGTALTEQHIRQLFRYTAQVILCFDGDAAGQKAAERALHLILPLLEEGKTIKFVFLPEKDDPDTFVRREGEKGFRLLLENATALSHVLVQLLMKKSDLNTLEGRAHALSLAKEWISLIPVSSFQRLLVNTLAEHIRLPVEELVKQVNSKTVSPAIFANKKKSGGKLPSPLERAIGAVLQCPSLASMPLPAVSQRMLEGSKTGQVLLQLMVVLQKEPNAHVGQILHYFEEDLSRTLLTRLASQNSVLSIEALQVEFQEILHKLAIDSVDTHTNTLLSTLQMKTHLTAEEKEKIKELLIK